MLASSCFPDLEYLTVKCCPYYLPREFTIAIPTAVYIPPHANVKLALNELYSVINNLTTIYPKAHGHWTRSLQSSKPQVHINKVLSACPLVHQGPEYPQPLLHINKICLTRSHFWKSDHLAVLLLLAYIHTESCSMLVGGHIYHPM